MKDVTALQYGAHVLANLRTGRETKEVTRRFGRDVVNVTKRENPQIDGRYIVQKQKKLPKFILNDRIPTKNRSISTVTKPQFTLSPQPQPQPQLLPYLPQITQHLLSTQPFQPTPFPQAPKHPLNLSQQISKLILIHQTLGLKQQTLFLTFMYFMEFMEKNVVEEGRKMLVAVACLWIASKFQEIYPPALGIYGRYVREFGVGGLVDMEAQILLCLDFKLVRPTALNFLQMLSQQNPKLFNLSNYLIQSSYYHQHSLTKCPSKLALTAYKIAQHNQKSSTNFPYSSNKSNGDSKQNQIKMEMEMKMEMEDVRSWVRRFEGMENGENRENGKNGGEGVGEGSLVLRRKFLGVFGGQ